jgi:hypothetical protein
MPELERVSQRSLGLRRHDGALASPSGNTWRWIDWSRRRESGVMPPQSKEVGGELTWRGLPAMTHQLARIRWHRLKFREPFNLEVFAQAEPRQNRKKLARLQHSAAALGLTLVPAQ